MAYTIAAELQPICRNRSGVGTYTLELLSHVRPSPEYQFSGNVFNFLNRNNNASVLERFDFPIHTCTAIPYKVFRVAGAFFPLSYSAIFGRADLNVFFNYAVPPRIKGRVITTVHDMTYMRYPETMNKRNYHRLRYGLEKCIERSDRILTISQFSKREIMELLHVPEDKICVVECAASLPSEAEDFGSIVKRWNINKPYILYVGNIEPRKNLVRLIHVFDRLKRETGIPHLLCLAGGNAWRNHEIYQAAEQSRYHDEILFLGFVTDGAKKALIQNAALLTFPSLYEGFGIPPLEAFALGCPVVCSNAASLPEVVDDAALTVKPLDEADIAQGIYRVLTDQPLRESLIQAGYQRAVKYTWDISAEKFMKVCRETLD